MKNFYQKFFWFSVIVVILFSVSIKDAKAETENFYFHGYAWSSNIGWIDMSGVKYVVSDNYVQPIYNGNGSNMDVGYAYLSGYAWSSNVGWISFNDSDTTDCPSSNLINYPDIQYGGPNRCRPKINLYDDTPFGTKGNELHGYAKILSYSNDGEVSNWADGWISLGVKFGGPVISSDGVNVVCFSNHWSYPTLTPPSGKCEGYAWGGNVTGWISFGKVTIDLLGQSDILLKANGTIGSISITQGQDVTLSWEGNNLCEDSFCQSLTTFSYSFNGKQYNLTSGLANTFITTKTLSLQGVNVNYSGSGISPILNKQGVHYFSIRAPSKYMKFVDGRLQGVSGYVISGVYVYIGVDPYFIKLEKECIQGNSGYGKLKLNTNIPSGTQCVGNASSVFSGSVPSNLPATSSLLSANGTVYEINCSGVSSNSVTLTCGTGPGGNGQIKKPEYKEN